MDKKGFRVARCRDAIGRMVGRGETNTTKMLRLMGSEDAQQVLDAWFVFQDLEGGSRMFGPFEAQHEAQRWALEAEKRGDPAGSGWTFDEAGYLRPPK